MLKKENENFQELINNLRIGDLVVFPLKGAFFSIRGEVRDFYFTNKQFYIVIYSFFKRKELTYILTEDLHLLTPLEEPSADFSSVPVADQDDSETQVDTDEVKIFPFNRQTITDELTEENPPYSSFFGNPRVKKVLALLLIAALLYPLFYYFISPLHAFLSTSYSYEEFLARDFALAELTEVVRRRVRYRVDLLDEWHTPAYAWENRTGDCEEMAALCAAYLTHHQVTCYLVGLQTEKTNQGHAVVFIKIDNAYYIQDPTRALEPAGFKALPPFATSLREAALQYSPLPATVYKIPTFNGEKKIMEQLN